MKIPLDFFLRLMQNFLNDIELSDLAEKFDNYVEVEEDDFVKRLGDVLKGISFKDIINFYVNSNEKFKKKIKAKVKQLENKYEVENGDEVEDEKDKTVNKLLNKKKQRDAKKEKVNHDKDDEEEEEVSKTIKKPTKESKLNNKLKEEEIDLNNLQFTPAPKQNLNPERKPFKRIDDSIKETIPEALKDNSYEAFMKKTGDSFGQEANNKLKFTKGKDFKKEKGKYKNKSSAGTYAISTTIRSIPLDDDSDA